MSRGYGGGGGGGGDGWTGDGRGGGGSGYARSEDDRTPIDASRVEALLMDRNEVISVQRLEPCRGFNPQLMTCC